MSALTGMHTARGFRHAARVTVCCVGTLALAVALAVIWPAISLHEPSASWWFALPVGAIMGTCVPSCTGRARTTAMILAAGGTLLCAVYAKCLHVGLELSAVMGVPYLHTLQRAGPGMLLALAKLSLTPRVTAACIAATLLALAIVRRKTAAQATAAGTRRSHHGTLR